MLKGELIMKKLSTYIDFSMLKRKEIYLTLVLSVLIFCMIAFVFLSKRVGKQENECLSPYVDNCSWTVELVDGKLFEQSFLTELDVLTGVFFHTITYAEDSSSKIRINILDENGKTLHKQIFNFDNVLHNQFSYFSFNKKVSIENKQQIFVQIESVGNTGENGISLVQSHDDSYSDGKFKIDGVEQNGDCFFGVYGYPYNIHAFNPLCVIGVILLGVYFLVVCFIILCKREEVKENTLSFRYISYSKIIKVIKIFIILCSIICVGRVGYDIITTVLDRGNAEYMVYIQYPEAKTLTEENNEIIFMNYAKNIVSNNIMIDKGEHFGTVSYSILDMDDVVLKSEQKSINSIVNSFDEQWDELVIDCSNLGLEQGREYKIDIAFEQSAPIYLIMNSNGQVQQRQIMANSYRDIYKFFLYFTSLIILIIIAYAVIAGFSDRVFLFAALLTGVIACFIQTPCSVDDEYRHFLRTYDLANSKVHAERLVWSGDVVDAKGNVIAADDGKVPIIAVSEQVNRLRLLDKTYNYDIISYIAEMNYNGSIDAIHTLMKQDESGEQYVSIAGTYRIPAIFYFPQVIMAWIGKILGMGAVGIFYMARIGNLMFAAFGTYLAAKMVPEYKKIFYLIYFAPNAFWISASCNRDALLTTLTTLFIAYVLYIRKNKLKIFNWKRLLLLSILIICIAICKVPYLLIAALLIILNKDNLSNISGIKCFLVKVALIALLGIVGAGGYVLYSHTSTADIIVEETTESEELQEETHISYALKYPKEVLKVFIERLDDILEDIYRAVEGYHYRFIKQYLILCLFVLLLSKNYTSIKEKFWCLLIYSVVWLVIILAGYTLMPPDYGSIWGINPRYMIPILPLLGIVIMFGNEKSEKLVNLVAPAGMLTLVGMGMISMITVYW